MAGVGNAFPAAAAAAATPASGVNSVAENILAARD